jgi:hypothetical protein
MLLKTARVWKPRIHGKIKGKNENFSGENGFPIPISCKFSKGIQKNESRNLRIPEIAVQNRESLIGDENLERERAREKGFSITRREAERGRNGGQRKRVLSDSSSHCDATSMWL